MGDDEKCDDGDCPMCHPQPDRDEYSSIHGTRFIRAVHEEAKWAVMAVPVTNKASHMMPPCRKCGMNAKVTDVYFCVDKDTNLYIRGECVGRTSTGHKCRETRALLVMSGRRQNQLKHVKLTAFTTNFPFWDLLFLHVIRNFKDVHAIRDMLVQDFYTSVLGTSEDTDLCEPKRVIEVPDEK